MKSEKTIEKTGELTSNGTRWDLIARDSSPHTHRATCRGTQPSSVHPALWALGCSFGSKRDTSSAMQERCLCTQAGLMEYHSRGPESRVSTLHPAVALLQSEVKPSPPCRKSHSDLSEILNLATYCLGPQRAGIYRKSGRDM